MIGALVLASFTAAAGPHLQYSDAVGLLDTVSVLIEKPDDLFSEDELQTKAELTLRRNGLRIVAREGPVPWIYVKVTDVELKTQDGVSTGFVAMVEVRVYTLMTFSHAPQYRTMAAFWSRGAISAGGRSDVRQSVLGNVEKMLEALANERLAAQEKGVRKAATSTDGR
jgi:hypothetical protein